MPVVFRLIAVPSLVQGDPAWTGEIADNQAEPISAKAILPKTWKNRNILPYDPYPEITSLGTRCWQAAGRTLTGGAVRLALRRGPNKRDRW